VDTLPLGRDGRILLPSLAARLRAETRLVCCSHAANETGVVHDVSAIADLCERRGVPCLVDGVQALGHVPVDLSTIACDFYVFAAHKFGGPRGCGGVFLRSEPPLPLMNGGSQEWGLRPGTENLPALAGAVTALERSLDGLSSTSDRLRSLARLVLDELGRSGVAFDLNANPEEGLPGLLSMSFEGLDGHALVADLAVQGFDVASGSACTADRPEPSRAILALGRSPAAALGTIRVSLGRASTEATARALAVALAAAVARLRGHA
jgi:cysteine desulfurase